MRAIDLVPAHFFPSKTRDISLGNENVQLYSCAATSVLFRLMPSRYLCRGSGSLGIAGPQKMFPREDCIECARYSDGSVLWPGTYRQQVESLSLRTPDVTVCTHIEEIFVRQTSPLFNEQ
jgi:hypothetical protein